MLAGAGRTAAESPLTAAAWGPAVAHNGAAPVDPATGAALFAGSVPPWLTGLAVCGVVLTYVFSGGLRAAAWANAFQTIVFMTTGVIAFVLLIPKGLVPTLTDLWRKRRPAAGPSSTGSAATAGVDQRAAVVARGARLAAGARRFAQWCIRCCCCRRPLRTWLATTRRAMPYSHALKLRPLS